MWTLNESHKGLDYTSRSMNIYLAGMFSLMRRGVCSLLGDRGIGLESQQLSPTGMGLEKPKGHLYLG